MNEPQPVGRPTLKTPDRIARIIQLAKDGRTEKEIADLVGIGYSTLRQWRDLDWEFASLLKESKEDPDDLVEASLFKSACGYDRLTKKIIYNQILKEHEELEEIEHYPPNPTSAIFWLKNRRKENWRDRREEEHKVLVLKQEIVSSLTTEELVEETQKLLASLHVQDQNIKS